MIRDDALLALKKAENKKSRLAKVARQESKANLAKARRNAILLIEQGRKNTVHIREVNYYAE